MMTFQEKVGVLQAFEASCYSICLYLLRSEELAVRAAERVLLDLFRDRQFWYDGSDGRMRRVRQAAVRRALQVKCETKEGECVSADI